MKYQDGNFIQIPRAAFDPEKFKKLTPSAAKLYFYLKNCEHCYTGNGKKFFWRTDSQTAEDLGLSEMTVRTARKQLIELGYINFKRLHYGNEDGTKSEKRVAAYLMLM